MIMMLSRVHSLNYIKLNKITFYSDNKQVMPVSYKNGYLPEMKNYPEVVTVVGL